MPHFRGNIENMSLNNNYYRRVIYTTKTMQLVLMSLHPKEEIGMEVHRHTSQFIRVESGHALAYIGSKRYNLKDGDAILVPANRKHNIINIGKDCLKLYTIYSPPEHPKDKKEKRKNSLNK